jgi:hypothetical protein
MKIVSVFILSWLSVVSLWAQPSNSQTQLFRTADSIAMLYPRHSLRDLNLLSHKLTDSLSSEPEKFRAIYRWVCENIAYDYTTFKSNQRQRERLTDPAKRERWSNQVRATVFKNLLEKNKTVCTGYAYLVKELASFAGIECKIIDGYGRNAQSNVRGNGVVNHSWNAVKLNGKWYLCDPTWSTGAFDVENFQFIKRYDDAYFLADPALFICNHFPLDTTWTLLEKNPALHQYLNRPLIYSTIYKYGVTKIIPDTFDISTVRGEKTSFFFHVNPESAILVQLVVQTSGRPEKVSPEISKDDNGNYSVAQIFKSRGRYAVHVLFDDKPAFTYSVLVH